MELEKIVVTPIIFENGHKLEEPRAHPGDEINYVFDEQTFWNPVNIVKLNYGDWAYFVDGVPGFLRGKNILDVRYKESGLAIVNRPSTLIIGGLS